MARLTYQPVGAQEIVRVEGTDYEQGMQLGRATAGLIRENVTRKKELLDALDDKGRAEFWRLARQNEAFLRQAEPDLFDELAGIAEGSGVDPDDLFLMNFHWFIRARNIAMECSCFFARAGATGDGKTYLAKTRDQQQPETHVVVERHYPSGQTVLEVMATGAPAFPPAGLNSSGLALASSGVWSKHAPADLSTAGSSYVMANIRLLLRRAKSIREAVDLINQSQYVAGINLTAVDAHEGATIEVTRDRAHTVFPGDTGVLTNHYVSEELRHMAVPREEYPSTYSRYERLQTLLTDNHGRIGFKELLSFLQDHEGGPQNAVCRHAVGPEDEDRYDPAFGFVKTSQSISQVALIIVVEDGELWATLVNPCEAVKRVQLD